MCYILCVLVAGKINPLVYLSGDFKGQCLCSKRFVGRECTKGVCVLYLVWFGSGKINPLVYFSGDFKGQC